MKKKFLLFGFALTSVLGASAQTCEVLDATIEPGGKGTITVKFDADVEWDGIETIGVNFKLPEGVSLGDWNDANWGGVIDGAAVPSGNQIWLNNEGFCTLGVMDYQVSFENGNEVTMTFPIVASAEVEEDDYSLAGTEGSMVIGDQLFIEDDNLVNGTLTVGAPTTYDAIVYTATGLSPMQFSNAALVEAYVAAHPNEIVEFASAPDAFAEVYNVVVAGAAKKIILDSRFAYAYSGEAFDAESVSFDYWIGVYASKTGGWNSLAIPFTGTPGVDPFTAADKENGEFWAKEFTHSTAEGLKFGDLAAAQFEANKSYLVAFPGSDYGVNEFASSSITISAANTKVYPATSKKTEGSPYSMTTVYAGSTPAKAYVLNPAGTMFELMENAETAVPFTAFASAESGAPVLRSLAILDANQGITSAADAAVASTTVYGEDGEIVIIASEAGVASIVNMNGQVVKANVAYNEGETRVAIAAGAYVVAGQVVIVK